MIKISRSIMDSMCIVLDDDDLIFEAKMNANYSFDVVWPDNSTEVKYDW